MGVACLIFAVFSLQAATASERTARQIVFPGQSTGSQGQPSIGGGQSSTFGFSSRPGNQQPVVSSGVSRTDGVDSGLNAAINFPQQNDRGGGSATSFGGSSGAVPGGSSGGSFGGNTGGNLNAGGSFSGGTLSGSSGGIFGGNTGGGFDQNTGGIFGGNTGGGFGQNTGGLFGGNTGGVFGQNTGGIFGGNTGGGFGQNTGGGFSSTFSGGGSGQGNNCNNCVSFVNCASALDQVQSSCTMLDGSNGVCCPLIQGGGADLGFLSGSVFGPPQIQVNVITLTLVQINQACEKGNHFLTSTNSLEQQLIRSNLIVQRGTPERGHQRFFKVTRSSLETHKQAVAIKEASKAMMNDNHLSQQEGAHGLRTISVRSSILSESCPSVPSCNPSAKYRTIDGSCNNLKRPLWGKSQTSMQRILPTKYDDGISSPRTRSVTGGVLPNPRKIASSIFLDINNPHLELTLGVMQWGQFLDHDHVHVPFRSLDNGDGINCCPNGRVPATPVHPECWPIRIPEDDGFYGPRGVTCMNFVRSMLGLNQECTFGYAEQMNQITSWMDASSVYGSSDHEASRLRELNGGLLKTSSYNLLPLDPVSSGDCSARKRSAACYLSGDSRVNEQPGLTAIHAVWHREHNRVAKELRNLHSRWSDEILYQEARRIITAEIQHISYNEWLPIILGPEFMKEFDINVKQSGYSSDYSSQINPSINNEFATAAYRFGHSLVQGLVRLFSKTGAASTIQLRDHFMSPHIFQQHAGVIDQFIRSFFRENIQKVDPFVSQDLSNHLFQTPEYDFGMDLPSLNINRGRDHGLATYNEMRVICGLPKASSFQQITDQIPAQIVERLEKIYAHVDDIDFFVGGISERPVSKSLLGHTFLCVVGDHFARIKKADRFFYDLGGQPGSFNEGQLAEIRRVSWARILCDNSDNLEFIQPLAFRTNTTKYNGMVSCHSTDIPRMSLHPWQRERV